MGWRSVRTVLLLTSLQLGWIGTPVAQGEQQLIVKVQGGLVEGIHFRFKPEWGRVSRGSVCGAANW